MDKTIKVIIVGNIAFDVNTFSKDNKAVTNNGGAGYYSLIPASLYTKVGIVARVGNDFHRRLEEIENIDTRAFQRIKECKTTKFIHTYLSEDGQERTFQPEVTKETLIKTSDYIYEYKDAEYIHVATNFPKTQLEFLKYLREHTKAKLSVDTHEAYYEENPILVKKVFDNADIAFIDKEFVDLLDCKANEKIIKRGKTGCEYTSEQEHFISPTNEVSVIDKTGAGDVVTGVFLALKSLGIENKKALDKAVQVATISIQDYGVDHLLDRRKSNEIRLQKRV